MDNEHTVYGNFNIKVNNANTLPQLITIEDKVINETDIFNLDIEASDTDGDELTYSVNGLPADASIDTSEGGIYWETDYESEGLYNVEYAVNDGGNNVAKNFSLKVNHVNAPPVLNALSTQVGEEASLLEFDITGSDIDNNTLTFSSNDLPTGANLSENGRFNWTPNTKGNYNFTVQVSDGNLTNSNSFSVEAAEPQTTLVNVT
jgi:hypothetical protein